MVYGEGPPRADPRVGAVVGGRYRIHRRLADGGMGTVYVAERVEDRRPVALKVLHAQHAAKPDIVARFRNEAMVTLNAVRSPHLVELEELGELPDGTPYYAMELLRGQDLAERIRLEGPLRVGPLVRIALQVCEGVAAAHDKGVVHRDLKPENNFLVPPEGGEGDPFVKVLDFGVSKFRSEMEGVSPSATRTGTTLGTPQYMPPEQAQAQKILDERVDVYALGVVLFRALTGQLPFDDPSLPVLIVKICTEPPPPVRRWREDVPEELEAVIERMLAKDRSYRHPSLRAVADALRPFADHDGPVVLREAPSTASLPATALATVPRHDVDQETAGGGRPPTRTLIALLFVVGLGTLLLAALVVGGVFDGGGGTIADDLPPLPEPRPPVTRTARAAGGDGIGWRWINPRPRAMPTWYAVDVASGGLVAFAGEGGTAARYVGEALAAWPTQTRVALRGVAWTGPRDALAVGDEGTVLRLGEDGVEELDSGVDGALRAVVAVGPTEAIAVGDGGLVLRLAGGRITQLDVGRTETLLAVAPLGTGVLIVGDRGLARRVADGEAAREPTGTDAVLRALGGCPQGDLYAAGDAGTLLRRDRRTGRWRPLRTFGREPFTGVSCDHGRVAAVRGDGSLLLVRGADTVRVPTGFDRAWHAVAGGPEGASWLVGAGGRLAVIGEDRVETLTDGPAVPIRALGSMGGRVVAVGEWGRILREGDDGLEASESPTVAGLGALLQVAEGRLLAAGDHGELVDIRFDRASVVPSPTRSALRDGVVGADRELLLVGAAGILVRGVPEALRATRVPEGADLWAVTGTPEHAVAVGVDGTVLRIGAHGVRPVPCAERRDLLDVAAFDELTLAVGEGGVIVRLDEDGCVLERDGGPTLWSIGPGPEGRPVAAGEDGTVLERTAEGTWGPADIDVGRATIFEVWRSRRDVYLAGSGGVLLRHPRLDGRPPG
ncbi:MAG: protein kinase [Sandaracinaceae bacterium]